MSVPTASTRDTVRRYSHATRTEAALAGTDAMTDTSLIARVAPEELAIDQICDLWCEGVGSDHRSYSVPRTGTIKQRAEKIVGDLTAALKARQGDDEPIYCGGSPREGKWD